MVATCPLSVIGAEGGMEAMAELYVFRLHNKLFFRLPSTTSKAESVRIGLDVTAAIFSHSALIPVGHLWTIRGIAMVENHCPAHGCDTY